ncbi:hypothetical protein BC829DRAFT_403013 [Chytridium lagenaria]|nr:hypothetical protein BC829DRAFT_403013 [Chytridium lagenaria]
MRVMITRPRIFAMNATLINGKVLLVFVKSGGLKKKTPLTLATIPSTNLPLPPHHQTTPHGAVGNLICTTTLTTTRTETTFPTSPSAPTPSEAVPHNPAQSNPVHPSTPPQSNVPPPYQTQTPLPPLPHPVVVAPTTHHLSHLHQPNTPPHVVPPKTICPSPLPTPQTNTTADPPLKPYLPPPTLLSL